MQVRSGKEYMDRNRAKTGIGMYTVHQSTERDMYHTFQRLAELGYKAIEFYGEPEYDIDLLKSSVTDAGLILSGWHIEWRNLQPERIGGTIGYLHKAGCPLAVVPCLGGKWKVNHLPNEECREIWLSYAEELNRLNQVLGREGIRLGYHNHEHEFQLVYDGRKVFDLLFDNLSEDVIIEFDTGNCIEGGDDPQRVLSKYRDREMILHLKPYSRTKGFDIVLGEETDANDWKTILNCEKEFRWLLIESENTKLPEMENARLCVEALQKIFE